LAASSTALLLFCSCLSFLSSDLPATRFRGILCAEPAFVREAHLYLHFFFLPTVAVSFLSGGKDEGFLKALDSILPLHVVFSFSPISLCDEDFIEVLKNCRPVLFLRLRYSQAHRPLSLTATSCYVSITRLARWFRILFSSS